MELIKTLNDYLARRAKAARPTVTRQQIVTDYGRKLSQRGMPLPPQREICRDLAETHGGKFRPEQVHRAKKTLAV